MNRNVREGFVFATGLLVAIVGGAMISVNWRRNPAAVYEGVGLALMGVAMMAVAYVEGRTNPFVILGGMAIAAGAIGVISTLLYGVPRYRADFGAIVLGFVLIMQALWVKLASAKTFSGQSPLRTVK